MVTDGKDVRASRSRRSYDRERYRTTRQASRRRWQGDRHSHERLRARGMAEYGDRASAQRGRHHYSPGAGAGFL